MEVINLIYTKETFYQKLKQHFPDNEFEILEFNGAFKPIKYKCLKCGKIIEKSRASHLYENKSLCQHCYSSKDSKIRNWILKFFKNTSSFSLINWSGNTSDVIEMRCNNCNRIFNKKPSNLIGKNVKTICPYCGDNGTPIPQEDFEKMMAEQNLSDFKILKYSAIGRSVKFQHSCGYVFSQIGKNFLKSKGCPKCADRKSKGELKIENFLEKNKIEFIYEYSPKDLNHLSYDFFLPALNTLIEYQGQQHYFPINYFGGEQKFQIQQEHDLIKQKYAEDKKIQLIIIPYFDFDKIETYLLPLLGSTTSYNSVVSSETKEETSLRR